ncbi:unnamed protein product (macronuclear) [Paramecium tetraurelia]|uniref:Uncharacterized protein n=1 Tax=Paramecium tetraurelia TaxID=5888 RepID=A0BHV2_PARTE|nr:uncharacterized protein GSPATT00029155001 [Paramecium tetraurelia]CAK58119.1 unnamed protein product [Paramecium tetraurelia]|eukprot:XP_001425517.1 hypothetical protein (macronuclear) [Paramecium tetraurelia strain d4-2]
MASVDQTQFTFIKHRHFTKKRKLEQKPRNYTYISSEAKLLFLQLFLFESYKIQDVKFLVQTLYQAAQKAGIKYSSAKTILFAHRKTFKDELIRNKLAANSIKAKCCGYKVKQIGEQDNIQIISRVGM